MQFVSGFGLPRATTLVLALLIASCAGVAPEPGPEGATVIAARQAESSGHYAQAARHWEEAAVQSPQPLRARYQLRAAEAWAAAGEFPAARSLLDRLDEDRLSAAERSRFALLRAEQALMGGDADEAAFHLDLARAKLPSNQLGRYAAIEDSIRRMRLNPASELLARLNRELDAIDPVDPEQVAGLMVRMGSFTSGQLREAADHAGPGSAAGGWAALIASVRRALVSGDELSVHAGTWADAHPGHAVSAADFIEIANAYGSRYTTPPAVAVLLPTDGSLAAAGAAIRDGLLSAYLQAPGRSVLRLYGTDQSPGSALAAFEQALEEGADWVVGPLSRESVTEVAALAPARVPVLLLNHTDGPPEQSQRAPQYSLSLSQEEEARAVARRMLTGGADSVITLASDNPWGRRMEHAFAEAYTGGGGTIADTATFSVLESDHSELLRRALQIDLSEQRKDRLQSALGLPLAFQPAIRTDFDAIFLSAGPQQARQLKPQLRFFDAGEKPVYAMGRAFSGTVDPDRDQDLNGIRLPLTPAQLEVGQGAAMPAVASVRDGNMLNLYALGMDAWRLLPWLSLLHSDPDLSFPGRTGRLRSTGTGQLLREPAWAIFVDGRPRPLPWPALND